MKPYTIYVYLNLEMRSDEMRRVSLKLGNSFKRFINKRGDTEWKMKGKSKQELRSAFEPAKKAYSYLIGCNILQD